MEAAHQRKLCNSSNERRSGKRRRNKRGATAAHKKVQCNQFKRAASA